jgi:hypothetical protein
LGPISGTFHRRVAVSAAYHFLFTLITLLENAVLEAREYYLFLSSQALIER